MHIYTMDTLIYITFVIISLLKATQSASIVREGRSCQSKLTLVIEKCLQKYEAKYLVYTDNEISLQLREAMEPILCREYESSLQCLHFALKDCPATDFHLQMISSRLGHVRSYMANLCSHSLDKTTKSTVSTSTTVPTTSTSSTSSTTTLTATSTTSSTTTSTAQTESTTHHSQQTTTSTAFVLDGNESSGEEIRNKIASKPKKKSNKYRDMLKKMNNKYHNDVVKDTLLIKGLISDIEIAEFQSLQQINNKECNNDKRCNSETSQAVKMNVAIWMVVACIIGQLIWI